MTHVLNARERKALNHLSLDHRDFIIKGQFPVGIGKETLETLVNLGLAEIGPSKRFSGDVGWRITDDGWRCMYGETLDEIRTKPEGTKSYPFRVWRWPMKSGARRLKM